MILFNEGATQAQADEAEDIVGVLTIAYPGHPWAVRVYDGGFFIRHLAFPANYGMNCKFKSVSHDAAVMRREIIRMAGEWLERAGLPRGRNKNEDEIVHLEGAPDRVQPDMKTDDVHIVMGNTPEVREAPRPQALRTDLI
jgi:hypothetical protein